MATHVRKVKCGSTIVIVTEDDDYEIHAEPEAEQEGSGGPADPPIYEAMMVSGAKLRMVAAIDPERAAFDIQNEGALSSSPVRGAGIDLDTVENADGVSVLFWADE